MTIDVCIKENLNKIKEQIDNIKVKIIAVTKYATQQQISEAYELGIQDFGESYVQDALKKLSASHSDESFEKTVNWHFIGRLQKNKVKYIVPRFYLIHSVDSLELLETIDNTAKKNQLVQNVLLQVNISGEESKAGFKTEELNSLFEKIKNPSNTKILGLMTMAPNITDKTVIKKCFLELKEIRDNLNRQYSVNLHELSMGMSNDYKTAVECGATMIRLGRAIFQEHL